MSRRAKQIWAGVAVAIVAVCTIAAWWSYWRSKPSDALLLAALEKHQGGTVKLDKIKTQITRLSETSVRVEFTAQGRQAEALFAEEQTRRFLTQELGFDFSVSERAGQLLRARDGGRLREWTGLGDPPADPLTVRLLREATPAGAPVVLAGSLEASRMETEWQLNFGTVNFTPKTPEGRRRAEFGRPNFVVGQAPDLAELKKLLQERQVYCIRLVGAEKEFAQKLAEERATRLTRLRDLLKPGSLFTGVARKRDETVTLYLEIVAAPAGTQKLGALLRNDGGWLDVRGFQGEWRSDEDATTLMLRLATTPGQQVRDGGPFLGFTDGWTFEGELDEQARFVTKVGQWLVEFERVPDADIVKVKTLASAATTAVWDFTAPEKALLGAVTNHHNGASEPLLVRFTRRDEKTGALSGYFQSLAHGGLRRAFSGTLVASKYRADGHPLRLVSKARERATAANDDGVLGNPNDLRVELNIDGEQMVGETGNFEYRFAQATPEQLAEIETRYREHLARFAAVYHVGATYDGTARHKDGFVGRIRLRIQQVDELEHTVTFMIDSRDQPGLYHQFSGAYDSELGTVRGRSTGRGTYNKSGIRRVPFLSEDSIFFFRLQCAEDGLTGVLANQYNQPNENWQFEFPVAAGPRLPTVQLPAGTPVLPSVEGAYVLRAGAWVALPRNNGRVASALGAQAANVVVGFLGALAGKGREAEANKVAELSFDGAGEIPEVPPESVIVLFVGKPYASRSAVVERYPELAGYPDVEMAPTHPTPDGKRMAELFRIVPGVGGFGDRRVAATVERLDENHRLLVCAEALRSGSYAIAAGPEQLFELKIK